MTHCPRCGAATAPGFRNCVNCRSPLPYARRASDAQIVLGISLGAIIVGSVVVLAIVAAVFAARSGTRSAPRPQPAAAIPVAAPASPHVSDYAKSRVDRGRWIVTREAKSIGLDPYCAFAGQPARLVVSVWDTTWNKLSVADRVNVTLAAEQLVAEARSAPERFIDPEIPTSAPAYPMAIRNTRALGDEDWCVQIVVGKERFLDHFAVEGGTASARQLRTSDAVSAKEDRRAKTEAPTPAAPRPAVSATPAPTPRVNEETVYVTRTGEKYHRDGCRYLRQSRIPMKLSDARRSYSACSVCW